MITGSIVALITPFDEDGNVSYDRLAGLVEWHISEKTDGILVLGTTAETPTLTDEEEERIVRKVIEKAGGRVPVIAGSGSNNTATQIRKSLAYQELGADALLVISPYYNKSNEEGIYRHLTAIADAADIPCILYNIPGRTGCSISAANVHRLSVHPNIMGIKEASGSLAYAASIADCLSDDFRMYSGEDALTLPLMSLGASGTISVWANVQPALVHAMCRAYLDGDLAGAKRIQVEGQPLIAQLFCEVNPIPVKDALAQMGFIEGPVYRMPLWPLTDAHRAQLADALGAAGVDLPVANDLAPQSLLSSVTEKEGRND